MSAKNPLTYGFRAIRRDPALLLIEILWRWTFGAIALFLLLGFVAIQPEALAAGDSVQWISHDPILIAQSLLPVVADLASHRTMMGLAVVTVTALWTLLGALGRTLTLSRLEKISVSFRTLLTLQFLRALCFWLAVAALVVSILLESRIALTGAQQDFFLYIALAGGSVILIGVVWSAANWVLMLAAVCCAKNAGGAARSIRQAVALVRSHSGDLFGVNLVFAVPRVIVLIIAFVLWFLPSSMLATAPKAYFAWTMVVTLGYFAVSDWLYLARLTGYLVIDAPDLGGETSSALAGSEPAES
jgi:hypothetical protein